MQLFLSFNSADRTSVIAVEKAVVGSSGSGNSSVVQAGLIPLLRREQPPVNAWDAISFTPGYDPLFAVKFERSRPIKA
jgi:conflict system STAND superfamily ATPase